MRKKKEEKEKENIIEKKRKEKKNESESEEIGMMTWAKEKRIARQARNGMRRERDRWKGVMKEIMVQKRRRETDKIRVGNRGNNKVRKPKMRP